MKAFSLLQLVVSAGDLVWFEMHLCVVIISIVTCMPGQ